MIRYALKCRDGHDFESWFRGAGAYDALRSSGGVACPFCGSVEVEKALMAPALGKGEVRAEARPLDRPGSPAEAALAELRRQVEENSEYVGMSFASEVRAIKAGEAPERSIYGEARADEARKLIEEGIAVAPLPFTPARNRN